MAAGLIRHRPTQVGPASRYAPWAGRQGHFRAFPVEADEHLHTVLGYVERNPLRAGLAGGPRTGGWGSLWRRRYPDAWPRSLHPGRYRSPDDWVKSVNRRRTEAEVEAVRRSVTRARPFGSEALEQQTAAGLGLEHTLRPRGRPKKMKWGRVPSFRAFSCVSPA